MKNLSRSFLIILVSALLACSPRLQQTKVVSYENISIQNIAPDTSLLNVIEPYSEDLAEEMNVVLAQSAMIMEKKRPESLLGNFVADLSLEMAERYSTEKIDLCIFNTGGLRSTLPAGEITKRDIYQLMPFENVLEVLTLSGEKVAEAAAYLADRGGDPVSGIRMSIENGKAKNIQINGVPLDTTRTYRVLTSDYLANGGDKMYFFSNPLQRVILGILLRDAIMLYVTEQGNKGIELNSKLDGRIINE